jgi:hypothetical protein
MITNEQLEALIECFWAANKGGFGEKSAAYLRAAFAEREEVRHKVTCKLFPDPHDEREPVGPCTCGAIPVKDDALNAARWRKLEYLLSDCLGNITVGVDGMVTTFCDVTELRATVDTLPEGPHVHG